MMSHIRIGLYVTAGIVFACQFGHGRQAVAALALGWLEYPARVLPVVTWDQTGLLTAAICLVLFVGGLHIFCWWIFCHRHATGDWKLAWTAQIAGLALTLAVTGIAMVGIAHQLAWLMGSKQSIVELAPGKYPKGVRPQGTETRYAP